MGAAAFFVKVYAKLEVVDDEAVAGLLKAIARGPLRRRSANGTASHNPKDTSQIFPCKSLTSAKGQIPLFLGDFLTLTYERPDAGVVSCSVAALWCDSMLISEDFTATFRGLGGPACVRAPAPPPWLRSSRFKTCPMQPRPETSEKVVPSAAKTLPGSPW